MRARFSAGGAAEALRERLCAGNLLIDKQQPAQTYNEQIIVAIFPDVGVNKCHSSLRQAKMISIQRSHQGFRCKLKADQHCYQKGNRNRNDKERDRSSTVERGGTLHLLPRQNAKREPVRQCEHEQDYKHPKRQQPEGPNRRKGEFQLQERRVKKSTADAEHQQQKCAAASWAHISRRSGRRKGPDGTDLSEKS